MRKWILGGIAAAAAVGGLGTLGARTPKSMQERPEAFEALVKCRAITDEKARLRCFDQASAALEQAAERQDLVVIDRKQIRETKRTLFGLEIPRLRIFGGAGGDADEEEVKSIESTVAAAYMNDNRQWVVRLEDGSTWAQTDHNNFAIAPRKGTKVKIVKAALGSYMMRIGNEPGVRARRQL